MNTLDFLDKQVLTSRNVRGGWWMTALMGGLNYQIEHHVFPDMSMLQYQRMQPAVKALCERYGVPYVQESVFTRLRKTLAVMLGDAALASKFADAMLERGVYVIGFSYPVVPQGKARIRTQISAAHTRADLEMAVKAFAEVGSELGVR